MAKLTIGFGVVLGLLGAVLYELSDPATRSLTAFIPSIFGILLIIFGILAQNEKYRMHAMHGAALVGLVGFVMPAVMVIRGLAQGGEFNLAKQGQTAMSVICAIFLGLCVKSFIDARAARKAKEPPAPN